jgi:hypothetical protein
VSRFIGKTEAKRLVKKLQMKYGAQLEVINEQIKKDIELFGFVSMDTEAKRELLFDQIKAEEKHYK